jgi:hypothetical protein
MYATPISFDTYSLQTATILTNTIDHESLATKNAQVYNLGHANRSVIPYVSYPSKQITISGMIYANDIPSLDIALDVFRSYFTGTARNLDIGYANGTRRYTATANQISITRPGGLVYASFNITFIATNPFGQDIVPTNALNVSGRTLASYTDFLTFIGSAPVQQPVITLTYTSITSGAAKTVIVGNNSNGQQITITRTFATGDILTFDVVNKLVTYNGVSIDYTGAFPEFPIGTQSLAYTDSFTARTFNINVSYYPLWY